MIAFTVSVAPSDFSFRGMIVGRFWSRTVQKNSPQISHRKSMRIPADVYFSVPARKIFRPRSSRSTGSVSGEEGIMVVFVSVLQACLENEMRVSGVLQSSFLYNFLY